ncbi:hypothetical protein L7F22_055742 [Adiantum nelumboides]|nr:hypothetical protein [Adiantum nelumboides]
MGSKARAEERRKKKMKKKSKKHRYSSSPPASSPSSTESSTSSVETRKLKKRRLRHDSDSESSGRKHRRRRHSTHIRRREKHAQKEDLSKQAGNNSATDENRGTPSPEEVASAMLCKFPELANDLKQLLKMLDDGQAVDLTGLTNEHVAAYLKQLFQSLLLQKTVQGLYFLPDGASRKTLDVLSSVLSSPERIKNSGQQGINNEEKDSPQLANQDGRADHYGPVEQKRRVSTSLKSPPTIQESLPEAESSVPNGSPSESVPEDIKEVVTRLHVDAKNDGKDPSAYVDALVDDLGGNASLSQGGASSSMSTHASGSAHVSATGTSASKSNVGSSSKKRKVAQGPLASAFSLQAHKQVDQALRRFFNAEDIPEWKVRSPFFLEMVKATGQVGPSYVPPTYNALRTTELNIEDEDEDEDEDDEGDDEDDDDEVACDES